MPDGTCSMINSLLHLVRKLFLEGLGLLMCVGRPGPSCWLGGWWLWRLLSAPLMSRGAPMAKLLSAMVRAGRLWLHCFSSRIQFCSLYAGRGNRAGRVPAAQ